MAVRVSRSLTIPDSELNFRFTPSGGPGGQHANKTSTRATLEWNVDSSAVLGPRQRTRIRNALGRRIASDGTLRISSDAYRSQTRNREEVLDRLARLVGDALRPTKARVATTPSRSATEKRLEAKRRRSELKRQRSSGYDD